MLNRILISLSFLSLIVFSGCSPSDTTENKTVVNTNAANLNRPASNANNPLNTNKTPEPPSTNNASTIAPLMASYYNALKAKDDAALKKLFTVKALANLEKDMKEEKKTSLSAFISELEALPEKGWEVRNEKIDGDSAVAEIKGGSYGVWTKMKFAKEGGEWKLTGESPEFEAINKTASNSNTVK